MKKKIFLVTSNQSPVPAVNGGAVETLIQILIEENELENQAEIYVLSKYDKEAQRISQEYKNTHVFYYKELKDITLKEFFIEYNFVGYVLHKILGKIMPEKFIPANRYAYHAYKLAKKHKVNYFVAEAGIYSIYRIMKKLFPRERAYAHFHRVVNNFEVPTDLYGHTISVSDYVKKQYEKVENNSQKVVQDNVVVYNCADSLNFGKDKDYHAINSIKNNLGLCDEDFVIIYSGRVVEEKGVLELVKAVSQLTNPNVKLIVAGTSLYKNGTETDYVKNIKEIAGETNGRVMCVGFVPNNQLCNYSALCNAWCVPSIYEEPAGLVVIEAMFSGIPIIMTGSGGMMEYSDADCAVIVDRENLVDDLKDKIMYLYSNPELCKKMGQVGKLRAELFSRKEFYKNFIDVFANNQGK